MRALTFPLEAENFKRRGVLATCDLAMRLGEAGETGEALELVEHVLALEPEHDTARVNYGTLLMQVGRYDDAIVEYDRLEHSRYRDLALFGKGFANLVLGNLRAGFVGFEHRKKMPLPPMPGTEWTGQPIVGKKLVVLGDMGHGDNLMFSRYCTLLAKRGVEVTVAVPPPMQTFFQCIPGIKVADQKADVASFDFWARMMSLAFLCGTDSDSVPPPPPVHLPHVEMHRWAVGLDSNKINVGLCWSGSRDSQYDRYRNVPLEALAPLFGVPNCDFYSLQVGIRDSDKAAFDRLPIFDIGGKVRDFRDTASFVQALDLVITVDTSIAHLAGTLGVPTRVMLTNFRTYWLWQKGRTDNPWYPGMSATRQVVDGDWTGVIDMLRKELEAESVEGGNHV